MVLGSGVRGPGVRVEWAAGVGLPPDRSGRTNGELDATTANDVLDFELGKLGVESKPLNDTSVLARRQPRGILRVRARNDHLSRRVN